MSNKEKRDKIRMIRTNYTEELMIQSLIKKNGFSSFAELVRFLIKQELKK